MLMPTLVYQQTSHTWRYTHSHVHTPITSILLSLLLPTQILFKSCQTVGIGMVNVLLIDVIFFDVIGNQCRSEATPYCNFDRLIIILHSHLYIPNIPFSLSKVSVHKRNLPLQFHQCSPRTAQVGCGRGQFMHVVCICITNSASNSIL